MNDEEKASKVVRCCCLGRRLDSRIDPITLEKKISKALKAAREEGFKEGLFEKSIVTTGMCIKKDGEIIARNRILKLRIRYLKRGERKDGGKEWMR
jgi:hypothetical protein